LDRAELIQRLVLDKICDDYENVDQTILADVNQEAPEFGITITRDDVVIALAQLIEQGLAKAYRLSELPPHRIELPGVPTLDTVEEDWFETYFLATPAGLDLQLNDSSWWPDQLPPPRS
jgi:hypothetical protein